MAKFCVLISGFLHRLGALSHALHHAPTYAGAFAEAEVVGQGGVGEELEGEGEDFDAFVGDPALVFEVLDVDFDVALRRDIELTIEGDDLVAEDLLEEAEALDEVLEGLVGAVVVFVEGDPVADVVAAAFSAEGEGVALGVDAGDAHGGAAAVELERPVGLAEEVLQFFDAFVEADDEGAAVLLFVLDEGEAVVKSAGCVIVVVEKLVFEARFLGYGAAEGVEFPGVDGRIELYGEVSDGLVHAFCFFLW